ncbi:MAG: hypothetical protein WDZ73_01325 [Candidatus Paceibacterota bacterium]
MNKKYYIPLLIIILLFIVGLWGFVVNRVAEEDVDIVSEVATTTDSNPFTMTEVGDRLIGEVFRVPGLEAEVVLSKGVTDVDISSSLTGGGTVVYLSSNVVEVKTSGQEYLVAPIAANTGGTGNFLYLILYKKTATGFEQVSDVLLGDRIFLMSLLVDDTYIMPQILASTLTRGEDEPLSATPSEEKIIAFEIRDDILMETIYHGEQ